MAIVVRAGAVQGVDGVPVQVEIDLLRRLPAVTIVGLAGAAVRESADRVRSAIQETGFDFPRKRVVINLAPADLRKQGTGFDLPVAVGILAASGQIPDDLLADTVFLGELGLDGSVRDVRGALPIALMAAATGARRLVLPVDCAAEADVIDGLEVLAADSLDSVCVWLTGGVPLPVAPPPVPDPPTPQPDLSEVRGQARARRALELAAAGGHNLLLVGPPGCGKSMLAARLPSILPDLSFAEAIEITRVHSVAGLVEPGHGLVRRRPFRAPHHSISNAGLLGNARLAPGELALAHNGVLFLDEVAEFNRNVLEQLRAPLEDRSLLLVRAAGSARLPTSVCLVAAANPCQCGFAGHPSRPCVCTPGAVARYRARLSGPLLDRIDLQVWVRPVPPGALLATAPGEASGPVRDRVVAARARQRARFAEVGVRCNAELTGDAIRSFADPTTAALTLLERTLSEHALSARAWSRMLKVARTIADLDGHDRVDSAHVLEASSYRLPMLEAAP